MNHSYLPRSSTTCQEDMYRAAYIIQTSRVPLKQLEENEWNRKFILVVLGSHSYLTILESKQREESTCTLLYSFDNVLTILLLYPIIYTYTLLNQTSPLLFNPKGGARDTGSPYCKA